MKQLIDKETGLRLALATHPKTPNYSMNARGRVPHLVNEKGGQGILTVCGMKVVRILEDEGDLIATKPTCGACRAQYAAKIGAKPMTATEASAGVAAAVERVGKAGDDAVSSVVAEIGEGFNKVEDACDAILRPLVEANRIGKGEALAVLQPLRLELRKRDEAQEVLVSALIALHDTYTLLAASVGNAKLHAAFKETAKIAGDALDRAGVKR